MKAAGGPPHRLVEGRREGVRLLCQALHIDLTDPRLTALARMDAAGLSAAAEAIARERRWPSALS
ncbi:MAG: hypothetical protein IT372_00880 [Polyangiaceae bacterium]|nr:hypothetical protein [Polyangiaceae bacterium]